VELILAWAEAHYRQTGQWPRRFDGRVISQPGETWDEVDRALRHGRRGLPGGDSLLLLLRRERGVVVEREAPPKRRRTGRQHLRSEAVALRQQGLTLTAIARRLGCHPTTVHYLVKGEC
jgi:hypothetical protein